MLRGSCMCGSVTFQFDQEPTAYGFCHCKTCQKASGTAFTANIPIDRSALVITGEDFIREYESSPGKQRCFCSTCGSPLYAYLRKTPDVLRIRLGSLDSPFTESPACHFFVGEQAGWYQADKQAPSFAEWPDPDHLVLRGSKQGDR